VLSARFPGGGTRDWPALLRRLLRRKAQVGAVERLPLKAGPLSPAGSPVFRRRQGFSV